MYKQFKVTLASTVSVVLLLSGVTSANARDFELAGVQAEVVNELDGYTDGIYIVRLAAPAIATYEGGISGYEATSAKSNGRKRLNTKSKAAKKYQKYLRDNQKDLLSSAEASFGRDLDTKYDYQHAINGFAVQLTAAEAKAMGNMAGVVSVQQERMEYPSTDVGPAFIGAPDLWSNGSN